MKKNTPAPDHCADFEAAAAHAEARYVLRLYITGTTRHSTRAIVNIRTICEEHLHGRYDLEVVDISQKPTLAEDHGIRRHTRPNQKTAAAPAPLHRRHVAHGENSPRVGLARESNQTAMKTPPPPSTDQTLRTENAELRARLDDAEGMLRAIRAGEVDALVVEGDAGPRLFTLQGLDAEQSRFRGEMLAQVSDALITTDREGCMTFLNPAAEELYRVRSSDVLGRKLSELYTCPLTSPQAETAAWAALDECGHWRGEKLHRTSDGRELHVELSCAIRWRRFAAPFLRKHSPAAQPGLLDLHEVIDRQSGHMIRLIDDLMDVGRVSRGKVTLKRQTVDLGNVVREAAGTVCAAYSDRNHDVKLKLPERPLRVDGDPLRLAQIVANLLRVIPADTPTQAERLRSPCRARGNAKTKPSCA